MLKFIIFIKKRTSTSSDLNVFLEKSKWVNVLKTSSFERSD